MVARLLPNRVRRTYLGGERIEAFTKARAPRDGALRPEDWLASTTTAFNGTREIEGEGLGRLEDGRLVRDVAGRLDVLVKLLDSDERLVIQAHPTVPFAQAKFNSPVGKTECWYFLPGTADDACVYLGFRQGVTKEAWRAAFARVNAAGRGTEKNELLDMLHRVPVRAGDFVFVDGGVPHAIGGGCFMIELQEPSDLMVVAERFTPSGREIPERKMHGGLGWDEMFDVFSYDGMSGEELCSRYVRRASRSALRTERILGPDLTDKFEMWRLAPNGVIEPRVASAVVVVTEGSGTLNGVAVTRGDRLLVTGEDALRSVGSATAIACWKATTDQPRTLPAS